MGLHVYNKENGSITNKRRRGKADKPLKLKEYKITNQMVADWFGYSSDKSFNNSSLKLEMLQGVEKIIRHIEKMIEQGT